MKKSVAMKWIAALRSGKYKQTEGELKGEKGYCCLGVLCDISKKGRWKMSDCGDIEYLNNSNYLPDRVVTWAGLNRFNPKNTDGQSLASLNDVKKWNFKKIADFIEKHWKVL